MHFLHPQAEGDIVEDLHMWEEREVLEHKAEAAPVRRNALQRLVVPKDPASVRKLEAGDHFQQGALTAATRTQHAQDFAPINFERYSS